MPSSQVVILNTWIIWVQMSEQHLATKTLGRRWVVVWARLVYFGRVCHSSSWRHQYLRSSRRIGCKVNLSTQSRQVTSQRHTSACGVVAITTPLTPPMALTLWRWMAVGGTRGTLTYRRCGGSSLRWPCVLVVLSMCSLASIVCWAAASNTSYRARWLRHWAYANS